MSWTMIRAVCFTMFLLKITDVTIMVLIPFCVVFQYWFKRNVLSFTPAIQSPTDHQNSNQCNVSEFSWSIHSLRPNACVRVSNLTIIGLSPGQHQAIYQNQYWSIVNWTLRNKHQWNFDWNSYIFIQENACETVIWKMATIWSQPRCVKLSFHAIVHTSWHFSLGMVVSWHMRPSQPKSNDPCHLSGFKNILSA